MRKFKTMLAVASAVALLAPSAAFAASGSEQGGYAGSNDVVAGLEQGSGGGGGPSGTTSNASGAGGSLPFTGSDLGVIGGAGALLLGLGLGLRRLTYRPTRA